MKELDPYLKAGIVDELDLSLVKMLLKDKPNSTQAFFLCHMSKALRTGSLGVEVSEGGLSPSAAMLWKNEDGKELPEPLFDLTKRIIEGSHIPENPYLIKEGETTYFLRAHTILTRFCKALKSYLDAEKKIFNDLSIAETYIHSAPLQEKQREACLKALDTSITLILGGPGTGKTYTAAHIVKALRQADPSLKIALAAPTGKAASNLKSALSMEGIDEPKTLHNLLNLSFKSKTVKSPYHLEQDLFIIDEASMIDIELMTALLMSMKPSSRLILLGDQNQLPPVDLGAPFNDIAEAKNLPKNLQVIQLDTCIRCESKEVLELSEKILKGSKEEIELFFKEPKNAVELIDIDSQNTYMLKEKIVSYALKKYEMLLDPTSLFSHQKAFCILTPFRVGNLGSEAINAAIKERALNNPNRPIALPIMIRENRPDLGLYNGDLGFLLDDGNSKTGLFSDKSIPELLLPSFEYAFCLSIHKSQGSEFDEALILIPEGAEGFGKKILYTALTRVKKRALFYSNVDLLCKMAAAESPKSSSLARLI